MDENEESGRQTEVLSDEEMALGEEITGLNDDTPPVDPKPRKNKPILVPPAPEGEDKERGDRGRPITGDTNEYRKPIKFPTPPKRKFQSESTDLGAKPSRALKWLNELPQEFKDRVDLYIYRDWPVLKSAPIDADTKRPEWFKYIDIVPLNDPNPIRMEEDLLNRYGCGRYRIFCNETDPVAKRSREDNRTVLQIIITGLGVNCDNYPPNDNLVTDIDKVDLSHPDNKSYVQYLRKVGKLTGDRDEEKEREDMANVQVVEKLMEQNERLTKQITDKQAIPASVVATPTTDPLMDVVKAAAMKALNGGGDEANKTNTNSIASLKELLELVKMMQPAPAPVVTGTSDEVKELRRLYEDERKARMEALEKQLERLSNPAAPSTTAPPVTPFAYAEEMSKAVMRFRDIADTFRGPAVEAAEEAAVPGFMKWLGPLTQVVSPLIQTGLQAWMMSQRAPAPPGAPAMASNPAPGMPMNPGSPYAPTPPMDASQAVPTPGMGMIPAPGSSAEPTDDAVLATLSSPFFLQVLCNYLNDKELDGVAFYEWFKAGVGQDIYSRVKKYGVMVEVAIANHPPIKPILDQLPEGRLHEFIEQFLDAEKILEDEKLNGDGGDGGVLGTAS